MFRFFVVFLFIFFSSVIQAQTIATIQRGKFKQSVPLEEVKEAYRFVINNTLNAPSRAQFVVDYVRYQIALIEAYNDKTLFKSANIQSMIRKSSLKKSVNQVVYKAFVENKMRSRLLSLNKEVRALGNANLRKTYSADPAFNFHFIVIDIPSLLNSRQLSNIKKRVQGIYSKVLKDKRPFEKLVPLYSDNNAIGTSNVSYTKDSLYPLIYDALKKLKPNQISKPVQTPNGFYILKLKKIIPFSKVNKEAIRNQIFTSKRSQALNLYFNKLQSKYKITINNQAVKTL